MGLAVGFQLAFGTTRRCHKLISAPTQRKRLRPSAASQNPSLGRRTKSSGIVLQAPGRLPLLLLFVNEDHSLKIS